MAIGLDPDQAQSFFWQYLGPNSLEKLSAYDTSKQRVNKKCVTRHLHQTTFANTVPALKTKFALLHENSLPADVSHENNNVKTQFLKN